MSEFYIYDPRACVVLTSSLLGICLHRSAFYDAVFICKNAADRGLILRFLLLVGAMAAGVGIGSKVLFALTQIPEFLKEPTLRNLGEIIWTSGFVFYGGLFGAILAVKLYAKVFRLNGQTFLDQIAPAFLLSISGEGSAAFCRLLLRKTRRLGNCHAADTGRATHSDSVDRNGLSACYFHRTAPAAAPKVPCSCAPDLSHFLCSLPVCAGIFPWGRIARHLAGPLYIAVDFTGNYPVFCVSRFAYRHESSYPSHRKLEENEQ